jgi:hypothetical protein
MNISRFVASRDRRVGELMCDQRAGILQGLEMNRRQYSDQKLECEFNEGLRTNNSHSVRADF